MTHSLPVWFLDVDGVVSPYGVGDGWTGETLYPGRPGDLTVPFRREVVEAISRVHDGGLVEVRWLTTWDSDLLRAWEDVGLGPFQVNRPEEGRRRWWKANVVEQWMRQNPTGRVVWTDDDLTPARLRGFEKERMLALAPEPHVGLTLKHLVRIERWLATS